MTVILGRCRSRRSGDRSWRRIVDNSVMSQMPPPPPASPFPPQSSPQYQPPYPYAPPAPPPPREPKQFSHFVAWILAPFLVGALYRDVGRNWRGIGFWYLVLVLTICWIPLCIFAHYGVRG